MAEYQLNEPGIVDDGDPLGTLTNALNWVAAGLSLALIAGLGVWGWQLLQRDVSGVPVVRAIEGPMRVAPADPGGSETAHRGLAVNRIAAVGEADGETERVVLAPAAQPLTEEDQPRPVLEAAAEVVAAPAEEAAAEEPSATDLAVAAALAGLDPDEAASSDAAPAGFSGLTTSPRPVARPVQAIPVSQGTIATEAGIEARIEDIPAGARLVQLGAYASPEIARSEWDRMNAQLDGHFEGKQRLIQKAETGGKTFYRLRVVGFSGLDDARRFCTLPVSRDVRCIPVVNR